MIRLTVGITTRDRPAALARAVSSLDAIEHLHPEILVFDDASSPPAADQLRASLPERQGVRVIRDPSASGYIVGRNRLVREAQAPYVLLMDDDAVLISGSAIERAMAVLDHDLKAAAVAFAQAESDGRRWPSAMQPGPGAVPAIVPSFIGFAHLLRRDPFLAHGGYTEMLVFYGEEKDLCLRLLDAGHHTIYLPDALVAHVPDPAGRSQSRYVRYVIRNDCLVSFVSEPLLLALVGLPVRIWRYTRMARNIPDGDPGGLGWLARELARALPAAWQRRRPVAWSTIRRWRHLARNVVPYPQP